MQNIRPAQRDSKAAHVSGSSNIQYYQNRPRSFGHSDARTYVMDGWQIQILKEASFIKTWDLQEHLRKKIIDGDDPIHTKHLLLVEHCKTLSLGRGEKGENLNQTRDWFKAEGFDVAEVNRGGAVTYHGPGQLVAYPIFHLQHARLGIKDYICLLENTILAFLKHFGLKGHRIEGHPGIYINNQKIGSVGIHVRKFVTIHGLSININPDLDIFSNFTSCGIPGVKMTSVAHEKKTISMDTAYDIFTKSFYRSI